MGFSRQEYWSGLPFPSPGHLPNPGIEPRSPALQADSLPTELVGLTLPFILRYPAWYLGTEKFLFTCEPNISTYLPPEQVLPKLDFSLYFFHSPHSSPNSSPTCLSLPPCIGALHMPCSQASLHTQPSLKTSSNHSCCLLGACCVAGPDLGSFHSLAHSIPGRSQKKRLAQEPDLSDGSVPVSPGVHNSVATVCKGDGVYAGPINVY